MNDINNIYAEYMKEEKRKMKEALNEKIFNLLPKEALK